MPKAQASSSDRARCVSQSMGLLARVDETAVSVMPIGTEHTKAGRCAHRLPGGASLWPVIGQTITHVVTAACRYGPDQLKAICSGWSFRRWVTKNWAGDTRAPRFPIKYLFATQNTSGVSTHGGAGTARLAAVNVTRSSRFGVNLEPAHESPAPWGRIHDTHPEWSNNRRTWSAPKIGLRDSDIARRRRLLICSRIVGHSPLLGQKRPASTMLYLASARQCWRGRNPVLSASIRVYPTPE